MLHTVFVIIFVQQLYHIRVNYAAGIDSIGYYSLHRSIMGCSLRVTRASVAVGSVNAG